MRPMAVIIALDCHCTIGRLTYLSQQGEWDFRVHDLLMNISICGLRRQLAIECGRVIPWWLEG